MFNCYGFYIGYIKIIIKIDFVEGIVILNFLGDVKKKVVIFVFIWIYI